LSTQDVPANLVSAPPGILAAVARGDATAFARGVDAFGPLVWSIARTYFVRQADAEDATQEAFLKLWKVAGQFDPARGSESAFVATVARSAIIDYRRRRGSLAPIPESHAPVAPASTTGGVLEGDEVRATLRAIMELPAEQRDALSLAVHRGLTQETIAQELGIPLGTVKTRIRGALIRLRDTLGAQGEPSRDRGSGGGSSLGRRGDAAGGLS
jgi:RNA polymerase sigma-70 factor (ECF subfamily)